MTVRRPDAPRWLISIDGPLDAGTARLALIADTLAALAGAAASIRFDDAGEPEAAFAPVADDLAWLGIEHPAEPLRTSRRGADYRRHLAALRDAGATIEASGTTRLRAAGDGVSFDDELHGPRHFTFTALGPIELADGAGAATADFRAAVDAGSFATPLVVRDDRQWERSAREAAIAAALGLPVPRFLHVGSLLADGADAPLPTIALLRRAGFLAGPVVSHLAHVDVPPASGARPPSRAERAAHFRLAEVPRRPAHVDEPRLRAVNARAFAALDEPVRCALLEGAMQRAGLLEDPVPDAARRWIATFFRAFTGRFTTLGEALAIVADLRAEAVVLPALELERLRNRQVVFYLDAVGQYVDAQPELRDLPLDHDLPAIAQEFGIAHDDAFAAVRMTLTGTHDGPPLPLLFPLLGHDRILIRIGAVSSHLLHGRGLEPIRFGPGGVPFQTIVPDVPPS